MYSAGADGRFDEALADALELGQREVATLASVVEGATSAYNAAGVKLVRDGDSDALLSEFAQRRLRFADGLSDHLSEQFRVLSTFNIAFFGRTGAGKSTLLSAFGELDGGAVSPFGESDWTPTVESIPWRGCRLYDTPGINGWGGRKSRDELEARARKAVEIADVVLLCFDTQSQQASEFAKVADWVTHYGKPVVAVLNVRNPRWRHPARVSSQAARRNMSEPVAQHAENVRVELANIGLYDVPVVAISSRRALFARAATPYQGPAEQNFHDDRDRYGIDYLARWSNFAALESVLTACITAGGSQLRLKSLREGIRARLTDEATSLEELRVRIGERVDELDRLTQKYLDVLGYLETEERTRDLHDDVWHSDLLTLAESARRKPYKAPTDGSLVRQVRNLLKPHLAEVRNNALRRYNDLEHEAFHEGKTIDAETFAERVFDDEELTGALDRVGTEAAEFLERELSLAGAELRPREAANYGKAGLSGNAGDTADPIANLLRGGGLAGGLAAMAVPFLLGGPVGIAAGIGVGAAAAIANWFGSNKSRDAVRETAEARAKATREGRRAIHETFDAIERQFASSASASAWKAAAPLLRAVLVELIALTNLSDDIGTLIAHLRAEATSIAQTPPLHFLDTTSRLLQVTRGADDARRPESFLLGEDWFDHDEPNKLRCSTTDSAAICRQRNEADSHTLHRAIGEAFADPDISSVRAWLRQAADAAVADHAFVGVTDIASPLPRPAVVVAGDYSAGKSSFIKRMFTEFGIEAPESLHIRADATTDEVHRYPMGRVDIVDTPGFQSRRAAHDELALAGVRDAALVIVVLHVNLLVGDTAALQAIANGTSTTVGKWPRMLFIVNRCDELGVDPLDSTAEYFILRDRKLAELSAALHSRGIEVAATHIHGVAADPFGSVGTQLPVTAADYNANRAWDGIAALVAALRAWVDDDLTRATTLAGFDNACSALLMLRKGTVTDIAACRAEISKHGSLIAAMDICLEDADYLHRSLEHELDAVLAPSVTQAVARIRAVDVGDEQGLVEAINSWRSPGTEDELKRFLETATTKVNDWSATHVSAISREEAAAGFNANLNLQGAASAGGVGDAVAQAAGVAGSVAKLGAQLGKALGNREAALRIGHFFGHKFKPWGAIKAGKAVGRVGVLFGVVAVAADGADWAFEANKTRNWDSKRDAAVEQVESDKQDVIQLFLAEPDVPWAYLNERTEQVRVLRDQYQDRQHAAQLEAERLERRLDVADELITAAEESRKVAGNG